MKPPIQALLVISIILLLVGSVVIFNSRSFSTTKESTTDFVTELETSIEYVTTTVQNTATSYFYSVPPSPSGTVTDTVYLTNPTPTASTQSQVIQNELNSPESYILVGGQNGTWFTDSQFPRLIQISLSTHMVRKLTPVTSQGTVWSGDSNGSEWLISGWGSDDGTGAPNPYMYLYNGTNALSDNIEDAAEAEWNGGDVFGISSNGSTWFLSGMGSGILPSYYDSISNHLSAGIFNGTVFTDLSALLPEQMDGILYANAFGNNEWLVGGGYQGDGVLFSWNGSGFIDLTSSIAASISDFGSIQSIGWNGQYWLIGGMGFLAMYNGAMFTDLTSQLNAVLPPQVQSPQYYVNAVAWNGSSWLIGGGNAVAMNGFASSAFLASFDSSGFVNLSNALPENATLPGSDASVLSIASSPNYGWIIGGYQGAGGLLLSYTSGSAVNLSTLTGDMTYVDWVGTS